MHHAKVENYQFDFLGSEKLESPPNNNLHLDHRVSILGKEFGITPVFIAYWQFAAERQKIFFRRTRRSNVSHFTSDPILARYKFTNAYRASDRVSQYLIRNVIYRDDLPDSDEEVFFRTLLFKLFNKIETWESLEEVLGPITLRTYDFQSLDKILSEKMAAGDRVYSAAYIMPSCGRIYGYKSKHQNHLKLLEWMLEEDYPEKLSKCAAMEEAYQLLLSAPSIGPFLAFQYVTDLNYSELTNFSEAEFVVAGPGALDGIQKCFVGADRISPSSVIDYMFQNQEFYLSKLAPNFESLWGRPLQLIDCQNLFCEISKYARVAFPDVKGVSDRKRIKQKFASGRALPAPWYPPKWNLNQKIHLDLRFSESAGSTRANAVHENAF